MDHSGYIAVNGHSVAMAWVRQGTDVGGKKYTVKNNRIHTKNNVSVLRIAGSDCDKLNSVYFFHAKKF